jgi:hypothetical protein
MSSRGYCVGVSCTCRWPSLVFCFLSACRGSLAHDDVAARDPRGTSPIGTSFGGASSSDAARVAATSRTRSSPSTPSTTAAQGGVAREEVPMIQAGSQEGPEQKREAAPGSTRGTIACGTTRCRARQEVCLATAGETGWACAPTDEGATDAVYACDDSSDCQAPRVCCRTFASASWVQSCELPHDNCPERACAGPEGAPCPSGQRCSEDGLCVVDARATCVDSKPCPPSAPVCVWSKSARCENPDRIDWTQESVAHFECTTQKDCGTQKCCTRMSHYLLGTACQNTCGFDLQMVLCSTDKDCDTMVKQWCGSKAPGCGKHLRCTPADPGDTGSLYPAPPPWYKLCTEPAPPPEP